MLNRPISLIFLLVLAACTTLPTVKHRTYKFPGNAYVGDPKREYTSLGLVKSKAEFPSLDPHHEEKQLCANYFNKAVSDLVKRAKTHGGEAVIDVKSVVFLEDGRQEFYPTPECSDDGQEGQVLVQGIAVKWKN